MAEDRKRDDITLNDIWGNWDLNNEVEIIAVASDKYFTTEKKVLEINTAAKAIADSGLSWSISSIWFTKNKYYIVGGGIFVKNNPNQNWQNIGGSITTFYTHSVRGSGLNDIVISGSGGDVAHFNGTTWKDYRNNGLPAFFGNYFSVSIKGNTICAVGDDGNKARIALGIR